MKVSEVQAGRKLSLEIKQVHDNLFLPEKSFNIEQEISILQSQLTGEIFITNQQDSWVIEGVNQDNQNKLLDLIDRSLPRLCWVMALQPNLQTPDTIFLQVHEFPNKLYLPNEKIEIGIDERIVDDIRDRHLRKSEPIDKIIEWLNKKILLPHPKNNQLKRALLQAGNKIKNSLENSFQLWGNGIVINIIKTADNKFLINRVERARQPKDINEQRPMIILEADICFCDASIAGSLRGNIQTELDDIVKNDSYLALWQEYNKIEQKIIWDNAREFGWLKYTKQIALKNGNYRFKLENTVNRKKELKAKFKLLRENPTLSLEVNKKPPNFSHDKDDNNEQDSALFKRDFSQDGKSFLGEVVEIDPQKLEIEIKPSNADDEEITPPHQGYIFISLLGDRIRLQRRTLAESAMRMAQNPMPQLALLLENHAVSFRRTRNIKPITKEVKKLFNGLSPTPRQEEAIRIALNTPDIALIQGPPGTGKTKVITAIEARLAEEAEDANRPVNHRILLTSYQHDAVENAAERTTLFQLPAVRIGGKKGKNSELDNVDRWRRERIQRVRASLAHLPKLTGQETLRKVKQLTAMYQLTPGNKDHVFESVIIDEAARANPLDLFIPMAKAERRIILVGDHRQLPHILEDDVEKELTKSTFDTQDALKKSLFERLFNQLQELERKDGIKRTVTLDTQYRMHPILGDFVSKNFYECHGESHINSGRCANDFIHNLPGYENSVTAWLNVPFSAGGEIQGQSKSRPVEARAIAFELKRLIEHDQKLTFGIIAFYSAQVTEIWKTLEEVGIAEKSEEGFFQVAKQWQETTNYENKIVERLRVGTVDAFQGKEFDVVFLSLTRSNNINPTDERMYRRKYGFLMLENRLCVAMSRQQRLLIAVGDGDMVNHKSARVAIPQLVNFYQLCQSQPGKIYQCYEKP